METTTKEIRQKLFEENQDKFLEMAKELRAAGKSDREIQDVISSQINLKTRQFYKKDDFSTLGDSIADAFKEIAGIKEDSKAEMIFYDLMISNGIKFEFQYQIGPYRVDYLINDNLIVELDGPTHKYHKQYDDKRDSYLIEKGYHIMRLPLYLVALDPMAAIESIKEITTK